MIVGIEKRCFKRLLQFELAFSQFYPTGMNTQYTIHTRAGRGFLGFGMIAVYSNANLSLPNGVVTAQDKETVEIFNEKITGLKKLSKELKKNKIETASILKEE
jgi:hypothetical protein